jgi:hypothetical protein
VRRVGSFLYVDDLVLITGNSTQLQLCRTPQQLPLLTDPQPWRAGIFWSVLFLFLLLAKGKHVGVFGFQRLDASAQGCYLLEGLVVQGLCDCLTLLCLELRVFGIARALQG